MRRRFGLALLPAALLLLGCPNPNIYGTPRTTPKGKFSHTAAAEGFYVSGQQQKVNVDNSGKVVTTSDTVGVARPTLPTYILRYGISDEFDFGVAFRSSSSLGVDVKWNPLRSTVDLAVAPGLQWYGVFTGQEGVQVFHIHVPLLVGINLNESLSLVLTPGFVYAATVGTFTTTSTGADRNAIVTSNGPLARFGIGVNIRPSKSFHLQPEVTGMRAFNDAEGLMLMFGVGFSFGHLPSYDDLAGSSTPDPSAGPKT
jgi:hypothetical protein